MASIHFQDDSSFTLKDADRIRTLYFPIASEKGLKSVVTPTLGGDAKLDQNAFLLEPESIENLHNNRAGRNFWCIFKEGSCWSAAGRSAECEWQQLTKDREESSVTGDFMVHRAERASVKYGLKASITSFVPLNENVEIELVELTCTGTEAVTFTPVAAIPIFGRSADNLRDHRHVTSLLHRIRTGADGIFVKPTLSFDERGHRVNHRIYYVCGNGAKGENPESFYSTVDEFVGGGTYTCPEAVFSDLPGHVGPLTEEGKEAVGGLRFSRVTLAPGESRTYVIRLGVTESEEEIRRIRKTYDTAEKAGRALIKVRTYWKEKNNISFSTGNEIFDHYTRWVSFQPFLRRIYGCSFLPHHDYGRGGRGWRDLWQDCLALLIMDPKDVRGMILDNFRGVRADGTNATIIGNRQGEFLADRNGITRVWMDHGMWPYLTVKLYIDQSGDRDLYGEEVPYFSDAIVMRGRVRREEAAEDCLLRGSDQEVYTGSVLEHLILEHVTAILETGDHGIIRLRGADWNDALDMAEEKGESAAFSFAYAGNLLRIAEDLEKMAEPGGSVLLMEELADLLTGIREGTEPKASFDRFLHRVAWSFSGRKKAMPLTCLTEVLRKLARDMADRLREQEWISDGDEAGWFNSYYDDCGRQVEGHFVGGVRMMLTGQVFATMSGLATKDQVQRIVKAADRYLYDPSIGGYRLNTDFKEEKYDLGRAFGFAYGEKENGAVFSHMAVMYAYALYVRGFAGEGYRALKSLMAAAVNFDKSRIYPGLPEYFNNEGRGMYHYLTGAASWYVLTLLCQSFGIRGGDGNLILEPKLVGEQFDREGKASAEFVFAGKKCRVTYEDPLKRSYGSYSIGSVTCDGNPIGRTMEGKAVILREEIEKMGEGQHEIFVKLI